MHWSQAMSNDDSTEISIFESFLGTKKDIFCLVTELVKNADNAAMQ